MTEVGVLYPTESDWYRHWQERVAHESEPLNLALRGGASADRLAWVFMSGYQAALARCFPEYCQDGWSCFAAAEPREGPGCELTEAEQGYRLNGQKSWIAGAAHVDRLVVALDGASRFVCLERDREGLAITLPRTPSFLAELSQGAAEFSDVRVDAEEVLTDPGRARLFRGAEPVFVLVALNACLGAHAGVLGAADRDIDSIVASAGNAVEVASALVADLGDRETVRAGLDALRSATRQTVSAFIREALSDSDEVLQTSWRADAGLFKMFGVAPGD